MTPWITNVVSICHLKLALTVRLILGNLSLVPVTQLRCYQTSGDHSDHYVTKCCQTRKGVTQSPILVTIALVLTLATVGKTCRLFMCQSFLVLPFLRTLALNKMMEPHHLGSLLLKAPAAVIQNLNVLTNTITVTDHVLLICVYRCGLVCVCVCARARVQVCAKATVCKSTNT
jgi:hypothetical protein